MRSCPLRAGLSRSTGSSGLVLGNPKGWLGSAYHEVFERIPEADLASEGLQAAVDRLWDRAIAAQHQRASTHQLDRRFGSPATWPGYHLALASVRLRAEELVAAVRPGPLAVPGGTTTWETCPTALREREFSACGGKLVGRPDVVRPGEVVDYNSGGITDYEEGKQAEVVKAAYVRQLRIYGYLVNEVLGWWPLLGRLLPLAGAGVEVVLEPTECEREALGAVALLDDYNAKARSRVAPAEFAAPSPPTCKWCPYKLICPPFWRDASPAWSGQLDGAAIEGMVPEPPRRIHGGAALAISLDIEAGSEAPRRVEIAPLNPLVHAAATVLTPGDGVRLVGLRVRSDGMLLPAQRTVLARVGDVPVLAGSPVRE
jgi:hypothetical protein